MRYRDSRLPPEGWKPKHVKEEREAVEAFYGYELPLEDLQYLSTNMCQGEEMSELLKQKQIAFSGTLPFALRNIVPFLSPNLITLSLVSSQQFATQGMSFPLGLAFPKLRELTLYSCEVRHLESPFSDDSSQTRTYAPPSPMDDPFYRFVPFPKLRYLHVAFHYCTKDPAVYFRLTPALEHLRITGNVWEHARFIPEVQSLIFPPPPSTDSGPDAPVLRPVYVYVMDQDEDGDGTGHVYPFELPRRCDAAPIGTPESIHSLHNLSRITFLPYHYDTPKARWEPPPMWLQEVTAMDTKDLINLIPPMTRTRPKKKRGYPSPAYIYGYADVEDDWKRAVERYTGVSRFTLLEAQEAEKQAAAEVKVKRRGWRRLFGLYKRIKSFFQ